LGRKHNFYPPQKIKERGTRTRGVIKERKKGDIYKKNKKIRENRGREGTNSPRGYLRGPKFRLRGRGGYADA
jgi:hypothetical protein